MIGRCSAMGIAFFIATTVVAGGCSSVTNEGGNTSCKNFNSQNEDKQKSEVAKMLKDQKGTEASNLEVSATRLSAKAFCETLGKNSSKISDINHG